MLSKWQPRTTYQTALPSNVCISSFISFYWASPNPRIIRVSRIECKRSSGGKEEALKQVEKKRTQTLIDVYDDDDDGSDGIASDNIIISSTVDEAVVQRVFWSGILSVYSTSDRRLLISIYRFIHSFLTTHTRRFLLTYRSPAVSF